VVYGQFVTVGAQDEMVEVMVLYTVEVVNGTEVVTTEVTVEVDWVEVAPDEALEVTPVPVLEALEVTPVPLVDTVEDPLMAEVVLFKKRPVVVVGRVVLPVPDTRLVVLEVFEVVLLLEVVEFDFLIKVRVSPIDPSVPSMNSNLATVEL